MAIFVKFFACQNGFLLITHLFKTSWTPSPVATPTKTGMPRRSKGSKHGVMFFFVRARFFVVGPVFFCRARLFSSLLWTFQALKLLPFDPA